MEIMQKIILLAEKLIGFIKRKGSFELKFTGLQRQSLSALI